MAEKFDPRTWLLGTLFTLALLFGGAVYSSIAATQTKVSEHSERLSRLEEFIRYQVEINRELKELHKRNSERDDRRDAR